MVVYLSAVSCILGFICLITGMLNMILVYIVDPVRTPDRQEDRKERLWLNRLGEKLFHRHRKISGPMDGHAKEEE